MRTRLFYVCGFYCELCWSIWHTSVEIKQFCKCDVLRNRPSSNSNGQERDSPLATIIAAIFFWALFESSITRKYCSIDGRCRWGVHNSNMTKWEIHFIMSSYRSMRWYLYPQHSSFGPLQRKVLLCIISLTVFLLSLSVTNNYHQYEGNCFSALN